MNWRIALLAIACSTGVLPAQSPGNLIGHWDGTIQYGDYGFHLRLNWRETAKM